MEDARSGPAWDLVWKNKQRRPILRFRKNLSDDIFKILLIFRWDNGIVIFTRVLTF